MRVVRSKAVFVRFALAAALLTASAQASFSQDLRTLIVGGGPEAQHNQVAIESNVRYVLKLLPGTGFRTVLFADGDPKSATVLYEQKRKELTEAERILALILGGRDGTTQTSYKYRAPSFSPLDGASKKPDLENAFTRLCSTGAVSSPVLLYFTGHGSPNKYRALDNNSYDLWGDMLSVKELAAHVAALPHDAPVTLIMVQCYSGSFGNLLFEGGDPNGEMVDRDIAGFFATVKERMAAGCTPAVDEREYHDFTSYFFAELTGKDRVGRKVKGADYNHDGKVGMDEAFCYTLTHDKSIDIPVCTSDVFLRRYMHVPDSDVFKTPYSQGIQWASAAQKAALEELARSLKLDGENRIQVAYNQFMGADNSQSRDNKLASARRAFRLAEDDAKSWIYSRWPDLKDKKLPGYEAAKTEALDSIRRNKEDSKYSALLSAERALSAEEDLDYERELADARLTRLVRLYKTVVLGHLVNEGSDETLKRRFARLIAAESRPLLQNSSIASGRMNKNAVTAF
jgi:hypothetical protein